MSVHPPPLPHLKDLDLRSDLISTGNSGPRAETLMPPPKSLAELKRRFETTTTTTSRTALPSAGRHHKSSNAEDAPDNNAVCRMRSLDNPLSSFRIISVMPKISDMPQDDIDPCDYNDETNQCQQQLPADLEHHEQRAVQSAGACIQKSVLHRGSKTIGDTKTPYPSPAPQKMVSSSQEISPMTKKRQLEAEHMRDVVRMGALKRKSVTMHSPILKRRDTRTSCEKSIDSKKKKVVKFSTKKTILTYTPLK